MARIRKPPVMTGTFAEIAQEFIQYKKVSVLNTLMSRNAYHDSVVLVKNRESRK